MTPRSSFYKGITDLTENRINELIRHAEGIEARAHTFPHASSYFRAHAFVVYLAWRDVTEGLHMQDDVDRLEGLASGKALVA